MSETAKNMYFPFCGNHIKAAKYTAPDLITYGAQCVAPEGCSERFVIAQTDHNHVLRIESIEKEQ